MIYDSDPLHHSLPLAFASESPSHHCPQSPRFTFSPHPLYNTDPLHIAFAAISTALHHIFPLKSTFFWSQPSPLIVLSCTAGMLTRGYLVARTVLHLRNEVPAVQCEKFGISLFSFRHAVSPCSLLYCEDDSSRVERTPPRREHLSLLPWALAFI